MNSSLDGSTSRGSDEQWNDVWKTYARINERKIRGYFDVFEFLKKPRNLSVIDLGCGSGQSIEFLLQSGFTNVVGVEPEAALFAGKRLNIRRGDLCDLSFLTETFDAVLLFGVLHHLRTVEEMSCALRNIRGIMKSGAELYSVEQWKNPVRSLAQWLVKDTPLYRLSRTVQMERSMLRAEWPELSHWLAVEKEITRKAVDMGLQVVSTRKDWRYRYIVFRKV